MSTAILAANRGISQTGSGGEIFSHDSSGAEATKSGRRGRGLGPDESVRSGTVRTDSSRTVLQFLAMANTDLATFAGGCFWGVEDLFRKVPGVLSAVSGYIGGSVDNPDYRSVCSGTTGHAEAVQITFDPEQVSYKELLHYFWEIHDPTTLNRQGPDVGTQYRSEIFTHSEEQMAEAIASKEWAQQFFSQPIVTAITPATEFFPAEEYHQEYFIKNGGHGCHVRRPLGR